MRIAIPTADGVLCPHFGHCQEFVLIDVDTETKKITEVSKVLPPPHEPGVLPQWLAQLGCNMIIAGGMGGRAIGLFQSKGINVICGAQAQRPEDVVLGYLEGRLVTGANMCGEPGFSAGGYTECSGRKYKQ
ncbi:MAG: ATPase [Candidatus Zixiibacteriota bacterium]|nr:MAG: ATPase [candidate division Zixibacteria bacterium]HDL03763.1 ATPase [candidate division Zixibacteria bacterium]